jgi:hypothetical protein
VRIIRHDRRSTSTGSASVSSFWPTQDQHGSEETSKENRGRTTTAVATANSITATLFGSVINMGVTAITSGSVLLCFFAAKRLI